MRKFLSSITLMVVLPLLVSCGSELPQVLKSIKVETSTVNSDMMMAISAEMDLGSMSFPSASIPIVHPHGQTPIGTVELVPVLGGKNFLKVSLNVSELSGVESENVRLPNGNMVPLIANNQAISIKLPRGAQLYLLLSSNVTAIGVAIPIAPFDNLGVRLPGLNVFPVVNIGRVVAAAGLFTGQPGQNGIAMIADVSKLVNSSSGSKLKSFYEEEKIELDYRSHKLNSNHQNKLNEMILRLNQKKTRLNLHR